ncbi:putative transcriptional regulator, Crp/Fnr family [Tenacibaculum jejuense]|uniref:Putative transcriptional regulator, Crp/Fnr family n=2 Tax=Tenacibaculum jejuense TaxID=584609 RepID=A0A238UDT8_9FLAO|nr:putative transcriptional regulator, Crp/Fnr family [Tenacibaculum jejuense]
MQDEKAAKIASFFEMETLNKGDLIIREGKTSKKSYFLESGIIRCYIIDLNGEEVTTRFYSAPDFLNDYLSFFKQKPSEENYEVLLDCKAWSINLENVQYCFHNIPEFREWGRMLLTLNYVKMHKHMISFHKHTAQERYENLLKNHPEIIQNIPLKIIASYLGITKYSLSRIRKNIS